MGGTHGCDKGPGGECHKVGVGPNHQYDTWTCGCADGYECIFGCEHPHVEHECALLTPAPTPAPTVCDDPSTRTCAPEASGGLCEVTFGLQVCSCATGYTCGAGCTYPFTGHVCTADPTNSPTASPTAAPTVPLPSCSQLNGCRIHGVGAGCGSGSAWEQALPTGLVGECGCKEFCSQYAQGACHIVWTFDAVTELCTCEGVSETDISAACAAGEGPNSAPNARSGYVD